jgi:hypothetical protein
VFSSNSQGLIDWVPVHWRGHFGCLSIGNISLSLGVAADPQDPTQPENGTSVAKRSNGAQNEFLLAATAQNLGKLAKLVLLIERQVSTDAQLIPVLTFTNRRRRYLTQSKRQLFKEIGAFGTVREFLHRPEKRTFTRECLSSTELVQFGRYVILTADYACTTPNHNPCVGGSNPSSATINPPDRLDAEA